MRKLIARACTALFVASIFLPFAAIPALANVAGCQSSGHYFAGRTFTASTGRDFRSMRIDIDISASAAHYGPCNPSPLDFDDNGVMSWVGIVSSPNTPEFNNVNAIIQVGVTRCSSLGVGACTGSSGAPHFFWASGGCGGAKPTLQDLGATDTSQHQYKIVRGTDRWYLYIDGTVRKYVLFNDSRVSCWAGDPDVNIQGMSEKWDKGDSMGSISNVYSTTFDNIQYSYIDNPNYIWWSPTSCAVDGDTHDRCEVHATDPLFWTYTWQ